MYQNKVIFGVHRYHHQVLGGYAGCTHVTSHLLALEHLARILTLAGRAVRAMRDRHTMRGPKTTEIVPLHRTSKTLTLGDANSIHTLTSYKMICA